MKEDLLYDLTANIDVEDGMVNGTEVIEKIVKHFQNAYGLSSQNMKHSKQFNS